MQELVWIVTLVLLAPLAAAFALVLRQERVADRETLAGYRAPLFWILVLLGAAATYITLIPWPHAIQTAEAETPITVAAKAQQWAWDLSQTSLPANKPIIFAVTAEDVNHNFALYDAQSRLLTQTQAMPGYVNKVAYIFREPGTYRVLCLEYCGIAHHSMIAEITVHP